MTTQLEQRKTATTTIRTGDLLVHTTVTTEVESVHVDFDDILAAVDVSPDDSMGRETPGGLVRRVHAYRRAAFSVRRRTRHDRPAARLLLQRRPPRAHHHHRAMGRRPVPMVSRQRRESTGCTRNGCRVAPQAA